MNTNMQWFMSFEEKRNDWMGNGVPNFGLDSVLDVYEVPLPEVGHV